MTLHHIGGKKSPGTASITADNLVDLYSCRLKGHGVFLSLAISSGGIIAGCCGNLGWLLEPESAEL